jgi:hypothetical protein
MTLLKIIKSSQPKLSEQYDVMSHQVLNQGRKVKQSILVPFNDPDNTTSLVARGKQAATMLVITAKMNTSQNAAKKPPRLMRNRKSISLQPNSFLDINAMAELSFKKENHQSMMTS